MSNKIGPWVIGAVFASACALASPASAIPLAQPGAATALDAPAASMIQEARYRHHRHRYRVCYRTWHHGRRVTRCYWTHRRHHW